MPRSAGMEPRANLQLRRTNSLSNGYDTKASAGNAGAHK